MTLALRSLLAATALTFVSTQLAEAGHQMVEAKRTVAETSPFTAGTTELQFGLGGFYSFGNYSKTRPRLVDLDATVRLGWMLTTAGGDGWRRGNLEFLIEAFGGAIVEGPGDVLAGATLLLRYNFVGEGARWVPYLQIGAGGVYSDASDEPEQRLLGSEFSFNLQGGLGLRYLFSERCAAFIEADYRHLSNAGLSDRNCGLNSVGGFVGVSYFY